MKQKPGHKVAILTQVSERAAVGWLPCCVAARHDVISDARSLIDGVGLCGRVSPALDTARAIDRLTATAAAAAACTCTQLGDVFISTTQLALSLAVYLSHSFLHQTTSLEAYST